MNRIFTAILALGLVLGLWSSESLALTHTYRDNTLVQASGDAPPDYIKDNWYNTIGEEFELSRIDVTWKGNNVSIRIYTDTFGDFITPFNVADVALDLDQDGIWETGVVLKDRTGFDKDTMYTFDGPNNNSHWQFSYADPGYVYGKNYDRSNNPDPFGKHVPEAPPVQLSDVSGATLEKVMINWEPVSDKDSLTDYLLTLTFTGVNKNGDWNAFDFLWATQTCANDTQYSHVSSHVPIPGSVLLIGTGLLGLGAVGFRRRRTYQ